MFNENSRHIFLAHRRCKLHNPALQNYVDLLHHLAPIVASNANTNREYDAELWQRSLELTAWSTAEQATLSAVMLVPLGLCLTVKCGMPSEFVVATATAISTAIMRPSRG